MTATRKPLGREGLMNVCSRRPVTEKTSLALRIAINIHFACDAMPRAPMYAAPVELMFEVKSRACRWSMSRAKRAALATRPSHEDWKKAYVRLAAGQSIATKLRPSAESLTERNHGADQL